jgi:hypothetical protein
MSSLAGSPTNVSQRGELDFWHHHPEGWNWNLPHYRKVFAFDAIDWNAEILDIGSGPRSVFEEVAPPSARVIPSDTLAEEYNRLIPEKRFPVVAVIPPRQFLLVTMFNMIDHMDQPRALLKQVSQNLHAQGELWLYVHLDRPFDPEEHPQCFRFWQVAPLMQEFFTIKNCGCVLETDPPWVKAFWCVCQTKRSGHASISWTGKLGVLYFRNWVRRSWLALGRRLWLRRA